MHSPVLHTRRLARVSGLPLLLKLRLMSVVSLLSWAVTLPVVAQTPPAAAPLAAAAAAPADDSLFQAWGGRTGIQAVMDDFFTQLQADPRTGPFFKDSERKHLVKQLSDQFCQVSGGPCVYDGPTMAEAHGALTISKADFNALVEVLQLSMDAKGIPFGAQNRMLARLAPMHRDIINLR